MAAMAHKTLPFFFHSDPRLDGLILTYPLGMDLGYGSRVGPGYSSGPKHFEPRPRIKKGVSTCLNHPHVKIIASASPRHSWVADDLLEGLCNQTAP